MQRAMTMTFLVAAMAVPMAPIAAMAACEVPVQHRMMFAEFPGPNHAGYLGVGLKDVSDDRVAALKLKDARGVEVIALDHDGPAAKVGIREHDVILDMNGQEVASEEQLRRMLRETPAGRKADLTLSRDGQEVKIEVVLGDRAQSAHGSMPDLENLNVQLEGLNNIVPANGVFEMGDLDVGTGPIVFGSGVAGANVETLGAQLAQFFGSKNGKGVLVKDVRNDSAAAKAGLKAGDVIVKAAGQPVASRVDWERVTRDNRGKTVSIEILREKRVQKLSITPPAKAQGVLAPTSFVIEDDDEDAGPEMMAEMQEPQDPQAQKELQDEMEKMRAEMAANSAEASKAMAEASAQVKAQMQSPEFKKEMEDAQRQMQAAAAEWKKNMPELKKELAEAQAKANREAAQWLADGPAMQAQTAQVQAAAEKAVSEWKARQPEMDKSLREAQEQMKKAAEQMRDQLTPMD